MIAHRLATAMLALLAGGALAAPSPTPPAGPAANRVRATVEFLADDLLEGRATGARGHEVAAAYVASQFDALGLQPAGEKGSWYQWVPMRRASTVPAATSITLGIGGKTLALGPDAAVVRPSLTEKARQGGGGLLFAGYGIDDPRSGLNDYAGLDARGKIVVVLRGVPAGLSSDVTAHLQGYKGHFAAARGAVGLIEVSPNPPRKAGEPLSPFASRPLTDWVDAAGKSGGEIPGLRFNLTLSSATAERLFEGAPKSLAQVRAETADKAARPRGFALKPTLSIRTESAWDDFRSPEVIAKLPGADPALKDQYVVLMGHLDHLGMKKDAKPGEDAIYNGALDNGAGVATMIEAARAFVDSGKAPRRSLLFIANTGEELGLIGADYFSIHPTVPATGIVGAVDLDMPVALYNFTDVTAFGADHSTMARMVAQAGKTMGVSVSPDPMPEESIFTRSDHYRLVERGIPAILLMTGYANGGKAKWDDYFKTRYHSVADDMTLPIDWNALARYAELNYRIARLLADADQRPMWYAKDYFGDLFAPTAPRAAAVRPQP